MSMRGYLRLEHKQDFLCQSRQTSSDGHQERDDTESGVDRHQRCTASCGPSFAAQQDEEAEESHYELRV